MGKFLLSSGISIASFVRNIYNTMNYMIYEQWTLNF